MNTDHNSTHTLITADNTTHCLECQMKDDSAYLAAYQKSLKKLEHRNKYPYLYSFTQSVQILKNNLRFDLKRIDRIQALVY